MVRIDQSRGGEASGAVDALGNDVAVAVIPPWPDLLDAVTVDHQVSVRVFGTGTVHCGYRAAFDEDPHDDRCDARRTASRIFSYPVQRQRFPASASRTSRSSGDGLRASRSCAATTSPGVQNPHWTAPASKNACCTGPSPSRFRPSTVVT